ESFQLKTIKTHTFDPDKIRVCQIQVRGMTCASCVNNIEKHLRGVSGIESIKVSLLAERAVVEYDIDIIDDQKIAEIINAIGFEASPIQPKREDKVEVQIFGMQNSKNVDEIKQGLCKVPGIFSVSIDFDTTIGIIEFDKEQIGIRDIVDKIENFGVSVLIYDNSQKTQLESLARTREITEWRKAFYQSLTFAIPVFIVLSWKDSLYGEAKAMSVNGANSEDNGDIKLPFDLIGTSNPQFSITFIISCSLINFSSYSTVAFSFSRLTTTLLIP
ncbi:14600_t:CDS:1, partial [Gigaspora rosea]